MKSFKSEEVKYTDVDSSVVTFASDFVCYTPNETNEELIIDITDSQLSDQEVTNFMKINRFLRWLIESEEGDIFLTALIIIPMIIAVMILIFTQVDNIFVMLDGMRRIYEQRLLKRCEERLIKESH